VKSWEISEVEKQLFTYAYLTFQLGGTTQKSESMSDLSVLRIEKI